jgi:hypothetical protein
MTAIGRAPRPAAKPGSRLQRDRQASSKLRRVFASAAQQKGDHHHSAVIGASGKVVAPAEEKMSRNKPSAKRKRLKQALGIAGVSLSVAGGASASTAMPVPSAKSAPLSEVEIVDVSLATFQLLDEKSRSLTQEQVFRIARGASTGAAAGAGAGRSCRHCSVSCRCLCSRVCRNA